MFNISVPELLQVFESRKMDFFLWLLGYLGGILLMLFVSLTIFIFHGHFGPFLPTYDILLVTATICLGVTGISYARLNLNKKSGVQLSPILVYLWPFLFALVYGVFVCIGTKTSTLPVWLIWIIIVFLFFVLLIWAAITWLHERGNRDDTTHAPSEPEKSTNLRNTAKNLPGIKAKKKKKNENKKQSK